MSPTEDTEQLLQQIQTYLETRFPDMDWRDRVELGYDLLYVVSKWAHGDNDTVNLVT